MQEGAQGREMHVHTSVYLSNTTAKRREIAKQFLGQFRRITGRNDVDIIGGDFNISAHRERGQAMVSSIEEAWGEALLIPPPDLVPVWGQIEDSRRLLWLHTYKDERHELAGCQVWKPPT